MGLFKTKYRVVMTTKGESVRFYPQYRTGFSWVCFIGQGGDNGSVWADNKWDAIEFINGIKEGTIKEGEHESVKAQVVWTEERAKQLLGIK